MIDNSVFVHSNSRLSNQTVSLSNRVCNKSSILVRQFTFTAEVTIPDCIIIVFQGHKRETRELSNLSKEKRTKASQTSNNPTMYKRNTQDRVSFVFTLFKMFRRYSNNKFNPVCVYFFSSLTCDYYTWLRSRFNMSMIINSYASFRSTITSK